MILDVRTAFVTKEGYAYTPVNYDHREHGPVLVREALASSYNVPAVIALKTIGVDSLLRLLGRLGVTTLNNPEDVDLSLTLGGGEIRLLDLTAAYAALANGGTGVQPVLILDVTDEAGDVVYQRHSGLSQRVIDERVAWLISDILSDNNARAPGFTTHSILQIGRPAAVKTGTTTDFRDNWTVGFTPNLVVGVWVGNADNSPMINISGVSGAGPIWHQFMRTVLRGQPELSFERPDDLVQVEVCTLSGLLPGDTCPYTRREWFIPGTQPTTTDTFYVRVAVDTLTGLPADATTPPDRIEQRVYLDLPPQAHDWARSESLPLLPDSLAGRGETAALNELLVVSPEPQTVYQLDPGLPLDAQRVRVVAVGPPGLQNVTLTIDDQPLATIETPPFEAYWTLAVGEHVARAEGTTATGESIESTSIPFRVNPPQ
jgi:membrane carboxypeptidase/penicillin-binding protein PbpC